MMSEKTERESRRAIVEAFQELRAVYSATLNNVYKTAKEKNNDVQYSQVIKVIREGICNGTVHFNNQNRFVGDLSARAPRKKQRRQTKTLTISGAGSKIKRKKSASRESIDREESP